jgi:Uma2 family endonuclease
MSVQVEPRAGASIKRHFVTLDEYDRMVEAGVFEPEVRIELIRGEIVDVSPPGAEHEASLARLHRIFNELAAHNALVWPQGNSIGLPQSNSRPRPDITLLRWRDDFYSGQRPRPEDVILLMEVSDSNADSSLKLDRGGKLQLYAEAGIREYWVANLIDGVVEVYTDVDPGTAKYRTARTAKRGDTIQLPGGLDDEIAVNDILGPETKA